MGIMRLLLAIAVPLGHCPYGVVPRFASGSLAVQCFYIISGFLIQFVITTKYRGRSGWQGRFYLSRLLRLFPLYWLFLLLTVVLLGTGYLSELLLRDSSLAAIWIVNNFFIVGQDVVRFLSFNGNTGHFTLLIPIEPAAHGAQTVFTLLPIAQAWTVALELYFYLLAPFLLTQRTGVLVLVVCLSVAVRLVLGYNGYCQPQWFYGFFPSELALFVSGSLACRAYCFFIGSGRFSSWVETRGGGSGVPQLNIAAWTVTAGICSLYLFANMNYLGGAFNAPPFGVPNAYLLVLLATVVGLPFAFHFSRTVRIDRYLGELSYPVYISHYFVLTLLEHTQAAKENSTHVSTWVLLLCLLLSAALIRYIEQPLDKVRHRLFIAPVKEKTNPR